MGGSGSQQGKDLQELGREKVKEFVTKAEAYGKQFVWVFKYGFWYKWVCLSY